MRIHSTACQTQQKRQRTDTYPQRREILDSSQAGCEMESWCLKKDDKLENMYRQKGRFFKNRELLEIKKYN